MVFQEKKFLMLFYWLIKFHGLIPLFLEILGNLCILIIFCPAYDVINFKFNVSLLVNPISYMIKKIKTKT